MTVTGVKSSGIFTLQNSHSVTNTFGHPQNAQCVSTTSSLCSKIKRERPVLVGGLNGSHT